MSLRVAIGVSVLAGLLLRILAGGFETISHDAAAFYLPNARALADGGIGNWDGMTIAVPPLFPTLIALVARVIPGDLHAALEQAALLLSALAGAALVFPVLALARRFFPEQPGVHGYAVMLVAIQPLLVSFGGDARADSMYALLFTASVAAGVATLDRPRIASGASFGLLVGLAYLLRPEALGLPLLLAVGVVVKLLLRRRQGPGLGTYFRPTLTAGVAAMLLLAPCLAWNMTFVHHKIGHWTLSPKAGILLDFDKGDEDVFGKLDATKSMTLHEQRLTSPEQYRSFSLLEAFRTNSRAMTETILRNLRDFVKYFPDTLGVAPTLLFLVGLWSARRLATRHALWVVLSVILFYGCALSIFYVTRRFWLPLLPLVLPWCGAGVAALATLRLGHRTVTAVGATLLTLVATLPQTLHAMDVGNGWRAAPELVLGAQLKRDLGPGRAYVSAKGKVTWYADGIHRPLPSASLADILLYMQNRGAEFLILDRAALERRRPRPGVRELWDAIETSGELVECQPRVESSGLRVFRRSR